MTRKQFFTVAQLGPKQSMTPEGYLLCEEVPIARIGVMEYHASELMGPEDEEPIVTPDKQGMIKISRDPEEVFRAETLASFNGKSVTDDHPSDGMVKPETWKELSCGVVMNVRRGEGALDDCMLADMLITVPDAIEAVRSGKREVSCGYVADYEETAPGEGKQKNIIGNHVALVEQGRCGWRCAIGDHKPNREAVMAKKGTWLDRLKKALRANDADEIKAAAEEAVGQHNVGDDDADGDGQNIHVHMPGQQSRFTDEDHEEYRAQNEQEHQQFRDAIEELQNQVSALQGGGTVDDNAASEGEAKEIEGELEVEAPIGTGDKARVAKDSVYLQDAYTQTVAAAEILAPGIDVPKFDLKADSKKTFRDICNTRRKALDRAFADAESRELISGLIGGRVLDTSDMSCQQVRTVFTAAASMKRRLNNDAHRGHSFMQQHDNNQAGGDGKVKAVRSVADLNKLANEVYGQKH